MADPALGFAVIPHGKPKIQAKYTEGNIPFGLGSNRLAGDFIDPDLDRAKAAAEFHRINQIRCAADLKSDLHGIRSLALERRILSTRTVERIESLVREGIFQRKQGDELAHALRFFIRLRLKAGLAELEAGRPVSGLVDVKKLSTLERDLLKDALTIVKRFKVMLRHRYRLDVL